LSPSYTHFKIFDYPKTVLNSSLLIVILPCHMFDRHFLLYQELIITHVVGYTGGNKRCYKNSSVN